MGSGDAALGIQGVNGNSLRFTANSIMKNIESQNEGIEYVINEMIRPVMSARSPLFQADFLPIQMPIRMETIVAGRIRIIVFMSLGQMMFWTSVWK
jgi:hypothetical protein